MLIKIQIKRLKKNQKKYEQAKTGTGKNVKQFAKSIDVVVVHQQHNKERINL